MTQANSSRQFQVKAHLWPGQ